MYIRHSVCHKVVILDFAFMVIILDFAFMVIKII